MAKGFAVCIAAVLAALVITVWPAMAQQGAGPGMGRGMRLTQAELERLKNIGVIDVHDHLFALKGNQGGPVFDHQAAIDQTLETMDRFGVKMMILMPPPYSPGHKAMDPVTNYANLLKQHPGRFAFLGGGGTLNPMLIQSVQQGQVTPQMRQFFKDETKRLIDMGAKGFGEMMALHFSLGPGHRFSEAPPDHPLLLLLADLAAHYQVPIDLHMELVSQDSPLSPHLRAPPNPYNLKANQAAFERLLSHNRGAKIVWSHAGWCNTGHRTVTAMSELLARHSNLYMSIKISMRDCLRDTSPLQPGVGVKDDWITMFRRFPDRFVIGADQFFSTVARQQPEHTPASRGPGSMSGMARNQQDIMRRRQQMRRNPGQYDDGRWSGGGGGGRPMKTHVGPWSFTPTMKFLAQLPEDLAKKIGRQNAIELFKLHPAP